MQLTVIPQKTAEKYIKKYPGTRHIGRLLEIMSRRPVKFLNYFDIGMRKKCEKLASELGINVVEHKRGDATQWDGSTLHIMNNTRNFLHEICHWQVAPQPYRFTKEYSLGSLVKPDKDLDKMSDSRPKSDLKTDETLAVVLEILWLNHWGYMLEGSYEGTKDWPSGLRLPYHITVPSKLQNKRSDEVWDDMLDLLIKIGLCDENYEPRVVARISESKLFKEISELRKKINLLEYQRVKHALRPARRFR